jgi:hypothetical protein
MTEQITEDFAHLESWDLLVESRQYRAGGLGRMNLRDVANFAFLDLVGLFILNSEYETASVASTYSTRTMGFRNFNKPRLIGTDLYVSLNIISNPNSAFSKAIADNPEQDSILRKKLRPQLPTVKRYLDLVSENSIRSEDAAVLLLRLEKQLNITDSTLRSIRRLAQDWPNINHMQRELVISRMMQYYRRFAKRSEIAEFLGDLGKTKGYDLKGPIDAELANLGMGADDKKAHGAGYNLVRNKKDK